MRGRQLAVLEGGRDSDFRHTLLVCRRDSGRASCDVTLSLPQHDDKLKCVGHLRQATLPNLLIIAV